MPPSLNLSPRIPYVAQEPGGCGIACLEMMLRFYGVKELPPSHELMEQARAQGLLSENGLVYNRVNRFVQSWGFKAVSHPWLRTGRVKKWIRDNNPVMVSLQGNDGGHLVVVCGIDSDKTIHILDPSTPGTPHKTLNLKTWKEKFNHRGITLTPRMM